MSADDEDRPPAGTPCLICKSKGHFCAAKHYVVNSDDGLCDACFNSESCPLSERKAPPPFTPESGYEFSPAKSIPRDQWPGTAGSETLMANNKTQLREEAKAMLESGISVRETAAKVGLAKGTVMDVRSEIPNIQKANSGGAPQHKTRVSMNLEISSGEEPPRTEGGKMSIAQAFEIVSRELGEDLDRMKDQADDSDPDDALGDSIEHTENILGTIKDYHPAIMGGVQMGRASIYDRALDRAQWELRLIDMELGRLTSRREAIAAIVTALGAAQDVEERTRA